MNKSNEVYFREVRRFRQIWIWALILPVSLLLIVLFGYGMLKQLVFDQPWGSKPMSDTGLAIFGSFMLLLGIGLLYLFYALKVVTEVRKDGIFIRYSFLSHQKISFEEINHYKVQTYNPIRDYGGWGIRYGKNGKAYNVNGNRGVQLKFLDGKQLLIGSQQPEELIQAIETQMKRYHLRE